MDDVLLEQNYQLEKQKTNNTDALGGLEFEETGSFEMINAADSAANGGASGLPDFGAPADLDADGYPSNNEGNLTTPTPSFPLLKKVRFPFPKPPVT